jgi:hypothetical protein
MAGDTETGRLMDRGLEKTGQAIAAANRAATAAFESAKAATLSANISRDALYLTQAADIQLDETIWEPKDKPPMPTLPEATITLRFKNLGHTAAHNVILDFALGITGTPVVPDFPPNPPVSIAAGQTVPYGFKPLMFIFSHVDDLISVAKGDRVMRVWGTITYDDVFGRHVKLRLGYTWIPTYRFYFG